MRFEHDGELFRHLFGGAAEGNGAGDVGGAVEILSAAVDQQQRIFLQPGVGVFRRLIVDDCRIGAGAGDGRETVRIKQRLLFSQFVNFFDDVKFA